MSLLIALTVLLQPTPPPPTTPDFGSIQGDVQGYQATLEALQQNEGTITTDGQQLYDENGQPLLPSSNSAQMVTLMSYTKWVLSAQSSYAVFGPFALIVTHVRIFFLLTMAWLGSYFLLRLANLLLKLTVWLLENWMVALILLVIGLVIGFIAFIEVRFSFVTDSLEWIMDFFRRVF